MLKFFNARKQYHSHVVVDIPQLEIPEGIYWLKGVNGSGKSTFLKMTAGLIPFDGEIEIEGIGLKKRPTAYRQLVSYAEAEPLYPDFISGHDLVHFYNTVRKADPKSTDELVDQFGIRQFYKNPIGTYSSGMAKKLSLVLAFTGETKFIFLDEPLVTLDQQSVSTLFTLIGACRSRGVNFIFTSHQAIDHDPLAATEIFMKENTVCIP